MQVLYNNLIEMALKHRDNISMPQTQFLYIFAHLLNMHFGVFYSGLKWNRDFNVTNLMLRVECNDGNVKTFRRTVSTKICPAYKKDFKI
jgi:hypothetical protein